MTMILATMGGIQNTLQSDREERRTNREKRTEKVNIELTVLAIQWECGNTQMELLIKQSLNQVKHNISDYRYYQISKKLFNTTMNIPTPIN